MCFFRGAQRAFKICLAKQKIGLYRQLQTVDFFMQRWMLLIFTPFSGGDAFALLECLCEIAR